MYRFLAVLCRWQKDAPSHRIKIPGDQRKINEKLDQISFECMDDEIFKQKEISRAAQISFSHAKSKLTLFFDEKSSQEEIRCVNKHLDILKNKIHIRHNKKLSRDSNSQDKALKS